MRSGTVNLLGSFSIRQELMKRLINRHSFHLPVQTYPLRYERDDTIHVIALGSMGFLCLCEGYCPIEPVY